MSSLPSRPTRQAAAKSPHAEMLRLAWFTDPDPAVASAGRALTTERVAKNPDGLDLARLLEVLKDYATPPNCPSPYAPIRIEEKVSRQDDT